jgi:hypothetical protein
MIPLEGGLHRRKTARTIVGLGPPRARFEKTHSRAVIENQVPAGSRVRNVRTCGFSITIICEKAISGRSLFFAPLLSEPLLFQPNPYVGQILEQGRGFSGQGARMDRGHPSSCHWNVTLRHARSMGEVRILTGYALSEDGVWRQHSWGLEGDLVFESTDDRVLYYGYELTPEQSFEFVLSNFLSAVLGGSASPGAKGIESIAHYLGERMPAEMRKEVEPALVRVGRRAGLNPTIVLPAAK